MVDRFDMTGQMDNYVVSRAGLRRCGAQLGTKSVGPGSLSTCTKVCRIGRRAQLGAIVLIGLRLGLVGRLVAVL